MQKLLVAFAAFTGITGILAAIVVAVGLLTFVVAAPAEADLKTDLSGFNEVHPPNLGIGAIFSTGSGELRLKINKKNRMIDYELSYEFPDATAPVPPSTQFVNQAHLHFGQASTTGGIVVWLCQSADNPAPASVSAATPMCPSPSGTVTGTIRPAQVLAQAPQGFPGGEAGFDALLEAIDAGAIYGNVHTDRFPPGEIRGKVGHGH